MSNPAILQRFTSEKHLKNPHECLKGYKNIKVIINESNLIRKMNAYV